MRKFLMILIVAGLAGGCLGWFMDWYRIGVSATAEGHQLISIDINTPKVGEDLDKAKQRLSQRPPSQQPASPANPTDQP